MEGAPSQLGDWQNVDLSEFAGEAPIATMYRRMFQAIEEDTKPPSNGHEGRWALEMILGIYESHRNEGARVQFPLAERRHPLDRWKEEASP